MRHKTLTKSIIMKKWLDEELLSDLNFGKETYPKEYKKIIKGGIIRYDRENRRVTIRKPESECLPEKEILRKEILFLEDLNKCLQFMDLPELISPKDQELTDKFLLSKGFTEEWDEENDYYRYILDRKKFFISYNPQNNITYLENRRCRTVVTTPCHNAYELQYAIDCMKLNLKIVI